MGFGTEVACDIVDEVVVVMACTITGSLESRSYVEARLELGLVMLVTSTPHTSSTIMHHASTIYLCTSVVLVFHWPLDSS